MLTKKVIVYLIFFAIIPRSFAQIKEKLLAAPDIIPPATEEMQNPEFWIARIDNPDRVIMTPRQIIEFNRKNRSRPLTRRDIYGKSVVIDSMTMEGNFAGISFHLSDPLSIDEYQSEKLKEHLANTCNYILKTDLWDRRQIPLPDERKRELVNEMNLESIPDTIHPLYGIVVKHTLNRLIPTHEKAYNGQFQWLDMFQNAALETGMTVAVLHVSKYGDWLFVKSEYSLGWVPTANIAFGSMDKIRSVSEPDDFIVVVTHKVPVYADRDYSIWLTDIYMGGRLELHERSNSAYRVIVPVRMPDGLVGSVSGWVKGDAEVNIGYQHYTQKNVITTIFRLLYRPYGWGGTDHERDCVGTIRAVYKTFGIFLPRWTTFELYHTDHVISFPADTPKEEKYRYLDTCEPGITVCGFNWHVVLYLGKVDSIHYVIHQNGYSYHDESGTEFRVGRVSVNHTELEGGADISRWTELSVFK